MDVLGKQPLAVLGMPSYVPQTQSFNYLGPFGKSYAPAGFSMWDHFTERDGKLYPTTSFGYSIVAGRGGGYNWIKRNDLMKMVGNDFVWPAPSGRPGQGLVNKPGGVSGMNQSAAAQTNVAPSGLSSIGSQQSMIDTI